MRRRRIEAVNDIRNALVEGSGPKDIGDFLVFLCERLTDRMTDVVGDIDDRVDAREDEILDKARAALRIELSRFHENNRRGRVRHHLWLRSGNGP